MTHNASVNLVIIGSGNGLSPVRRQAITWTNAALSSIWIWILSFPHKKCIWKCRLPNSGHFVSVSILTETNAIRKTTRVVVRIYRVLSYKGGQDTRRGVRQGGDTAKTAGRNSFYMYTEIVVLFLAATKQLYEWYFLSVCLSVCPSVRLSVCHTFLTMFPSSYHHEIFRSYHIGPG